MNHKDFKEAKYLKSKFFKEFTLGKDAPGKKTWIDDDEKQVGCALGWTETSVEYFINSWRYRGQLLPEEGADAAFGCSYTFGLGVDISWPALMGVVNCGQNAASNDQIARLAITYCKTFKPKNIYVMWTFAGRREHANGTGVEKFGNVDVHKKGNDMFDAYTILSSDATDLYNIQKNQLLLESFCEANDINLHQLTVNYFNKDEYPLARDNMHPGPDWHLNVSSSFET